MRPSTGTFPLYFSNYIALVKENDLQDAFVQNWKEIKSVISTIPLDLETYAYGPEKWTIKQVVSHVIDTERIFAYRALRFARKDPQLVASFDENIYAANAELSERNLKDLMTEWEVVRKSNEILFRSFGPSTLLLSGKMASGETTVLSLGFMICGHALHHLNIIKERYLGN